MRMLAFALFAAAGLAVSACSGGVKPPFTQGVCYAMEAPDGKDPVFNVVARDQPAIEYCAASLEEMRMRFMGFGSTRREVIGAYQGRFIFVDGKGVSYGQKLDGIRFFALARTGDGRLAVPGAIDRGVNTVAIVQDSAPATPPSN